MNLENIDLSPIVSVNHGKDEINILLRDLSLSENLSVIDLLKNYNSDNKIIKSKSAKSKLIIKENLKRNEDYAIKRDKERLDYFSNLTKYSPNLLNEIPNFNTEYGKQRMKLKLLKLALDNKQNKHIINLYLQVLADSYDSNKEVKLMKKTTILMNNIDYKKMQFELLSNELAPLDFYNGYTKKLDEWQINVLKLLDDKKSVLVTAPTSCGKTWLSIYPGIKGLKILFIVPTDALTFQVASLFTKFVGIIPTMVTSETSYMNSLDIIIGTPKSIEDKLPLFENNFDLLILDEIHNLGNKFIGQYYERLLKIFADTQILALSATIYNPEKLISWILKFHSKNLEHVHYTTRFLNLQRQLFYNNRLTRLHPISCLTLEDINEKFLIQNLPMTPVDCIKLFNALKENFPDDMSKYEVKEIFPENNRRLSLEDSRKYELILKKKLIELKNMYPEEINDILNKFKINDEERCEVNLFNLFQEIKKKNLIPSIVFQENTCYCKDIYCTLVGYLEKLEKLNYPFYYTNLEFRLDAYQKAESELKKFKESIKIPQDTINPKILIEEKEKKKKNDLLDNFIKDYKKLYNKQVSLIEKDNVNEKIKKIQLENLKKELTIFLKNPKLQFIDIYRKHKDFCLNNDNPMSADIIRTIKKNISQKLNIDVSYTNVFLQGLKRGIGIYTKHMPSIYNLIVQKFAQNGELGFVVADEELALGINMPFRSTCILGYKDSTTFQVNNYIQMIGRAGRRGKDVEGHIIFADVDWRKLMKSELSEIVSSYIYLPNYYILSQLTNEYNDNLDNIFKFPMNDVEIPEKLEINTKDTDHIFNILIWKFREYQNIYKVCDSIPKLEKSLQIKLDIESIKIVIEYIIINFFENDEKFFNILKNIIKYKKIVNLYSNFKLINQFLKILKEFHNTLIRNPDDYISIINHLRFTYEFFNKIINNCNDLN